MNASFDTAGGDIVRVELLQHQEAIEKQWYEPFLAWFGAAKAPLAKKDVILFDRSASRYYVAQTGLWPSPAGPGQFPEHHTLMTPVPGERTLKAGANELQVKFESPVSGGVKLVKTYTFTRGDYAIGVRHEIVNESGAPVSPLIYYQLVRDGNPPPGGSSLYFTFTGPAIYTDTDHYKKIDFSAIEKREGDKVERVSATSGWVAMVQHYFLDGVAGRHARRRRAAARVLHRQARQQHLLGRHARSRRDDRAEREQGRSTPVSTSARRKKTSSPASRRGSSWSRTTAGSRSSPSRCSGC